MPKIFRREHYTLRTYKDEQFKMETIDDETNLEKSEYSNNWKALYMKAKKLSAKGKNCTIWELKYSFE